MRILSKVKFIYDEYHFKVVFIREQESKLRAEFGESSEKPSEKSSEKSSEKLSDMISDTILELIRENPQISASKIADKLNTSSRRIERHIALLKQSGKLERIGADRGGMWKIIEK